MVNCIPMKVRSLILKQFFFCAILIISKPFLGLEMWSVPLHGSGTEDH